MDYLNFINSNHYLILTIIIGLIIIWVVYKRIKTKETSRYNSRWK